MAVPYKDPLASLITIDDKGNRSLSVQAGLGISRDAWGKQKIAQDFSLIHGMFTNAVPSSMWKELINDVESTTYINATSANGLLLLTSGATLNDVTVLQSYRNPRYEPNRGHLYSSSMLLPSPTAAGIRDFGIFTGQNGVFFRCKADGLYACRRYAINGVPTVTTVEEKIDLTVMGPDFDLALGNIYDIQMQWRGVGNIKFFIGDSVTGASILVHSMDLLGTLTALSISNPALPLAFRCENLGAAVVIKCGCVDVSSEGGTNIDDTYGSISIDNELGSVNITGFNAPVLVVRNKKMIGTLENVRDVQAYSISAYSDAKSFLRVWYTRDETAITLNDQVWRDFGDGFLEFIQYDNPNVTTPMSFDTTKAQLTFGARVILDGTLTSPALFDSKGSIHQTPGDIFIFTMHRETGSACEAGVTYEFGEKI